MMNKHHWNQWWPNKFSYAYVYESQSSSVSWWNKYILNENWFMNNALCRIGLYISLNSSSGVGNYVIDT